MIKKDLHINILLKYLVPIYILAVVILTLFRGIFVCHFYDDFLLLYESTSELYPVLLKAFAKGFRYDNIVLSHLMALPLIALIIFWLFNVSTKLYITLSRIYFIIAFALVFALSCMDFPYFKYFWTHPTVTILDWIGFGGTFGMLFQESSYYIYYLLFFLVMAIIILATIYLAKKIDKESRLLFLNNRIVQVILCSLACLFCFWGTRGHLNKEPIGIAPAMFSMNVLVKNLCLTPSYYFVYHLDDRNIDYNSLMATEDAIQYVQREFNVHDNTTFNNPLSRKIFQDSTKLSNQYNIILVYMESMSAMSMYQEVNEKKLTPFLDSLASVSYYFENFYSSGVHTNAGVGSTLTSYPSRFDQTMMGRFPPAYKGIATTLQQKSYRNLFFISHNETFDNIGTFLRKNDFEEIYSVNDYPQDKVVSYFGVQDDFLLQYAKEKLNKLGKIKVPFFANILTISNHPPVIVPEKFKDSALKDKEAILNFADNSIKEFMTSVSQLDWYKNTIFIFQGDHGSIIGNQIYNMPLSNNHIPLIIYSPTFDDMPQRISELGGQIDIFPTIMGLLNQSYTNNTMGIDLLKEKRPYMFFSSDTHLGCIDDKFFYTFNPKDKSEYLYDETKKDGVNIINSHQEVAEKMKEYALSMLTAANALEEKGLVEEY